MPNFGSLLQPNGGPDNNVFQEPHAPLAQQKSEQAKSVHKDIKVILNCFGQKELIKDVPLEFEGEKVLLVPILNHIKYLGKPIAKQSISYFSEEDEMDVYVGIEGVNIKPNSAI
jgi:hypothetical protein